MADANQTRRFLGALFGRAPVRSWIELRFRVGAGMGRSFHPADRLDRAAAAAVGLAARTEVFVGVIPRARRGGGRRDLVQRATVVWADCDGPAAVHALKDFRPAPALIVASGGESNQHAYWLLAERVGIEEIERMNRRVAIALGADLRCGDGARIMRPAGSINRKHSLPTAVRLLSLNIDSVIEFAELERAVPDLRRGLDRLPRLRTREASGDPLLSVSPVIYVARLTGQRVGRSRKVRCPFHDDRTPSLHVYEEPERGWFCFGCGVGGSIYDLAALLWRRTDTRGSAFVALRRELSQLVLPASATPR